MADVIFFLGILYHLDFEDALPVLHNIYNMCRECIVIDTLIRIEQRASGAARWGNYHGLQRRP
jgi:hypothetical protein